MKDNNLINIAKAFGLDKLDPSVADLVNPKYYQNKGFECFDVIEQQFGSESLAESCICQAFQYIFRSKKKENRILDLLKACKMLIKGIEMLNKVESQKIISKEKESKKVNSYVWECYDCRSTKNKNR
jgi:hypothetical protein|nr:MAG TPA: nucelotide kinase [Caudoviricetes sp.]